MSKELHSRAISLVKQIRKSEAELLDILDQIEKQKLYLDWGYSSLFQYAVDGLGLSEGRAYNFITVTRKSREVPSLRKNIESGKLPVSKARKIASVIDPQNEKEWILKAQQLSQKLLEREVAKVSPRTKVKEGAHYIDEKSLELKSLISEETYQKLLRAQDLVSQSKSKAASLDETLSAALDQFLEKKDPVQKAKRREKKLVSRRVEPKLKQQARQFTRTPIPAPIQHQVMLRDKGRCQFPLGLGGKCNKTRWIHLHHIKPITAGGGHSVENLITLCSAHHAFLHKKNEIYQATSMFSNSSAACSSKA